MRHAHILINDHILLYRSELPELENAQQIIVYFAPSNDADTECANAIRQRIEQF